MTSRWIAAAIGGALAFTVVALPASAGPATIVYAAPNGNGAACTRQAPCSITQAQLKARGQRDLTVSLAGGTYQLSQPLTFTEADSGAPGHPIRWQAAPGQTPVISGGLPIGGWQRFTGNVWSARVPSDLTTRQLYADGVRLPRAQGDLPVGLTQTATGFTAANTTMSGWRDPDKIEFAFTEGHGAWTEPRCGVDKINGVTITMDQPCWDNMKLPDDPRGPFGDNPSGGFPSLPGNAVPSRVENAFELLSDGEWYLDEARDTIYYQGRPGEDVRKKNFVAAKLDSLVRTTTSWTAPLHDVSFEGLEFAYATWLQPSTPEGFVEMQANMTLTGPGASKSQGLCQYSEPKGTCPYGAWTRPAAAVDLTGTRNVTFLRNTFQHLGGAGLGLQHGVQNDLVQGNTVTDVSGIGILLGAIDDPQPLNGDENEIATGNTIDSNYVHHTGVEFPGAPAIVNGYSRQTKITHNQVSNVSYSGISSGWAGWHTNSVTPHDNPNINADNTIANNVIYGHMGVRHDGGAIYTNGPQGTSFEHGLTVQGNVSFAGVFTSFNVYNDEGGDYVTITGNVQYADPGGFNGGCSTTGHIRIKDNYRTGALNWFGCPPAPVGIEVLDGNKQISQNPQAGEVPNAVLAAAGLRPEFQDLVTRSAPEVVLVSPTCTDDLLISGSGFTGKARVTIGGRPVQPVTYIGPSQLSVKLPQGVNGGAISVTTKAGTSSASAGSLLSPCRSLSTTFNNVGITDDWNRGPGNVDGYGYSYSAQALAQRGIMPGSPVRTHGVTFTWPAASAGSPNNTLAAGQFVGVYGQSDTLGFLMTSTHATEGKGTVYYTDGSIQEYTIGSTNWADGLQPGVVPAITAPYRNGPGGQDTRPVWIFYSGVAIDPHKTVKSVRLPNISSEIDANTPAMHIFAVALGGGPDLAQGKIARASTEVFGGLASRVNDGDSNGSWYNNSVSHSDIQDHPWWQVDLGASSQLQTINVWNRTDCCADRLNDFWVFVSATPFDTSLAPAGQAKKNGVWSAHMTGAAPVVTTVQPNVSGRYVMVQLNGRNYLSLAEVEVFGGKPSTEDWVGTWGAAQAAPAWWAPNGFANRSVRNVLHSSVGGTSARVRFSNRFGTSPLVVDKSSIALGVSSEVPDVRPGTMRQLTFSGQPAVTIPAGAEVQSDPVNMMFPADTDLVVSLYTSQGSGPATYHPAANQINYLTTTGDHALDESGVGFDQKIGSWVYVEEIDVRGSGAKGTVVTFGDSITDGGYTTTNSNHRWPDYLADRTKDFGIVNSGISAGRLMLDGSNLDWGRSGLARLDDDTINRTNVRTVILLQGINDMIHDPRNDRPDEYAAAYQEFVARMHAKSVRVLASPITPFKGWEGYDEGLERTRQGINDFVLHSGTFDGVVDFASALADPSDPLKIRPEYDAGDHLHPSDAGNAAMAAAVDLAKL
ncbi:GDSL-type esterase/lipase family protein [Actinocrispum sp. NPDC049592]|uniref:GDSL-type esterase/lipase family protein n=1 Tax=Actinocrispum sp. NPDC049592 TaxID=3154835 RepID=UPI0034138302